MTDQAGTGALDAAIDAAARAVWASLGSELGGWDDSDEDEHNDAREVATAAVRAAAPLIPVLEQQRADIERDALLRAAEDMAPAHPYLGDHPWTMAADWLRARAASVGTEEG